MNTEILKAFVLLALAVPLFLILASIAAVRVDNLVTLIRERRARRRPALIPDCDLHTHSLFASCANGYTTREYLAIRRATREDHHA